MTTSSPAAAPAQLTGGDLGTVHVIGQSLALGPIFSAGAVMSIIATVAGFNTPLSVLLGFVSCIGLAYVIVIYAQRFSGAGAMYEYLSRAVHTSFGMFAGGIYLVGAMFLGAGGVFIFIGYLTESFFATYTSLTVPWWVASVVSLAIASLLNYRGVKVAVNGVLALAIVSAIPFVYLSIVIIAKGGVAGNTLSVFNPGETSWNSVFKGVLFAVTLFIGFEAAAALAEETREPKRSIPIAVMATVAISGVFFLLVSYAGAIGFGKEALSSSTNPWASAPSAFGTLATTYVGSWLGTIIDLMIIFDAISLSIGFMVAASRIIFTLSRDGLLPKPLARTSKYNTPMGGLLLLVVWTGVLLVWTAVSNYSAASGLPNTFSVFLFVSSAGSYLIEVVYVFLCIFAVRLVWRSRADGGLAWKLALIVLGIAAPLLAFWGSLSPFPAYPFSIGVWLAVATIIIAFAWWAFVRATRPEVIVNAGSLVSSEATIDA